MFKTPDWTIRANGSIMAVPRIAQNLIYTIKYTIESHTPPDKTQHATALGCIFSITQFSFDNSFM